MRRLAPPAGEAVGAARRAANRWQHSVRALATAAPATPAPPAQQANSYNQFPLEIGHIAVWWINPAEVRPVVTGLPGAG